MLNYIWGFMILVGIVYGSITGNIAQVGNGILDSAKEAVNICLTMLGVMALWTGIMEIAERSGLVEGATNKLMPFLSWLFPEVPAGHRAFKYISLNFIANILGLGWAATPAGLKAMEELAGLNGILGKNNETASNAMCTFLVINISSLQLIPVNIIAYRSQYGSVNPSIIIMPVILATLVSTLAGIIFCVIANKCFTKSHV
jgi:spore maturation protein A